MKLHFTLPILIYISTSSVFCQLSGFDINTGKPQNLTQNPNCNENLQNKVFQTFLDDQNLANTNPDVFNSTTEIKILKNTDLFISYISEETEGNMCLAYYTYKTGTKPSLNQKANVNYLFPRVNSEILTIGNSVKISNLKVGYSVGFVIFNNAWTGKKALDLSSKKWYSSDTPKSCATAYDIETNEIIIGFETDQKTISDFNDLLFSIHCSEKNALKTQNFSNLKYELKLIDNNTNIFADNTNSESNKQTASSNYYTCFDNGMTEDVYKNSLKSIRNTNDDINRIKLIKASVENFKITPNQAKEYCSQLSNYSYRYEMAKYLIDFECEIERASIVSEVFRNTNYEANYIQFINLKIAEKKAEAERKKHETDATSKSTPANNTVIIIDPNQNNRGPNYPPNNYPKQYPPNGTNVFPPQYLYGTPFSLHEFDQLVHQVNSTAFDHNKEILIERAVQQKTLNTLQIQRVLVLFSMDNYKLSMCKYLFDYTTDYQNYYSLQTAFTFQSYKNDLYAFLKSRGY